MKGAGKYDDIADKPVMDVSDALVLDAKEKARKLVRTFKSAHNGTKNDGYRVGINFAIREIEKAFDL